jgi:hypothetical protein
MHVIIGQRYNLKVQAHASMAQSKVLGGREATYGCTIMKVGISLGRVWLPVSPLVRIGPTIFRLVDWAEQRSCMFLKQHRARFQRNVRNVSFSTDRPVLEAPWLH